jgi:endonuclease/exonuclease/phosphatase family metal-dependent hydrolase
MMDLLTANFATRRWTLSPVPAMRVVNWNIERGLRLPGIIDFLGRWFLPRTEPFQKRLAGRIALVTEIEGAGRNLAVYNLHLESRGNHDIRLAQMEEVLEDAARQQSGFRSTLGLPSPHTTPARGLFQRRRTVDWAFVSGPVETTLGHVHADVGASDHYPIPFTIRFS